MFSKLYFTCSESDKFEKKVVVQWRLHFPENLPKVLKFRSRAETEHVMTVRLLQTFFDLITDEKKLILKDWHTTATCSV